VPKVVDTKCNIYYSRVWHKSVGLCLLIFGLFFQESCPYQKGTMFIKFWIFKFPLLIFFKWLCMYKKCQIILFKSGGYAYSRGYVYWFCQLFQGLHLFKGLHLFHTLEYIIFMVNKKVIFCKFKHNVEPTKFGHIFRNQIEISKNSNCKSCCLPNPIFCN
jgi:hypothetical protein